MYSCTCWIQTVKSASQHHPSSLAGKNILEFQTMCPSLCLSEWVLLFFIRSTEFLVERKCFSVIIQAMTLNEQQNFRAGWSLSLPGMISHVTRHYEATRTSSGHRHLNEWAAGSDESWEPRAILGGPWHLPGSPEQKYHSDSDLTILAYHVSFLARVLRHRAQGVVRIYLYFACYLTPATCLTIQT